MTTKPRKIIAMGMASLSLMSLPGCSPTVENPEHGSVTPPPDGSTQFPPIIAILDANQDGILSPAEIEGAGRKLMYADWNGDGKLTMAEAEERAARGSVGLKMPMYRNQVWGP